MQLARLERMFGSTSASAGAPGLPRRVLLRPAYDLQRQALAAVTCCRRQSGVSAVGWSCRVWATGSRRPNFSVHAPANRLRGAGPLTAEPEKAASSPSTREVPGWAAWQAVGDLIKFELTPAHAAFGWLPACVS